MSDYSKLVEALRKVADYINCYDCDMWGLGECDTERKSCVLHNAADAIEALQAEIRESMQKCAECGDRMVEPKRGEWIEDTTTYAGPGLSNYKCSLCGKICGTWRRGLEPSELPNWCGNCGADMRAKMEVQE